MAKDKGGEKSKPDAGTGPVALGEDQKAGAPTEAPTEPPSEALAGARVCSEHDRAGGGLRRYKLRCVTHETGRLYVYVLAGTAAAAEACYREHVGIGERGDDGEPARLFCKELPD